MCVRVICFLPSFLGVLVGVNGRVGDAFGFGCGFGFLPARCTLDFLGGAGAPPGLGKTFPPARPPACAGTGANLRSTGPGSAKFTGTGLAPPAANAP